MSELLHSLPSLPKEFVLKSISDSSMDPQIVSYFYPRAPITEQYRRLRENIKTLNRHHNFSVVSITSSVHNEGKTVTAMNLAVTMAQDVDCRNILLIDCDLRRGRLQKAFGLKTMPVGLSECLSIGADLDNIVYKTAVNKLKIIPRGMISEQPAELLASNRLSRLLQEARKKYDFVILDTPPVIPVADATIVGAQVDATFMVVKAGATQKGVILHATEHLEQSRVNLAGYILTSVEHYIPEYLYKYV